MKTFSRLMVLTALLWAGSASATIYTANNNTNRPKGDRVFSTVDSAIAAASEGDTIHVVPSNTDYGSASVNKRLVILGAGVVPQKDIPVQSRISGILIYDNLGTLADPSGSVIEGIVSNSVTIYGLSNGYQPANNVAIRRCRISSFDLGGNTMNGFLLSNCVVSAVNAVSTTSTGILLTNNIFEGGGVITVYNALLTNNIWLGSTSGTTSVFSAAITGNIITNNIFLRPALTTGQNVYSNNLTYNTGVTELVTTGNSGGNNIPEQDPLFVNYPLSSSSLTFSSTLDFHLQSGSPAIGKASNGGDIGIYGGSEPFDLNVGIPLVQQFNTSGVAKQGNPLQVTVKAKAF